MASARVNVTYLKRELAKRAWNFSDLARHADLAPATITAVMAGRLVMTSTVSKIAFALLRHKPIPGAEELIETTHNLLAEAIDDGGMAEPGRRRSP